MVFPEINPPPNRPDTENVLEADKDWQAQYILEFRGYYFSPK